MSLFFLENMFFIMRLFSIFCLIVLCMPLLMINGSRTYYDLPKNSNGCQSVCSTTCSSRCPSTAPCATAQVQYASTKGANGGCRCFCPTLEDGSE